MKNEPASWKPIPDWPQYEVSSDGRLRCWSIPGFKSRVRRSPRYKKTHLGRDGYARATLCENSHTENQRVETFLVHRLVATCFVPGKDKSLDVAHLDGCKTNNLSSNLKWVTKKENEAHKIGHGTKAQGARNGQSKLCERAVLAIRSLVVEEKWSQTKVANLFQVTQKNVSAIILRKSWRQL